MKRAHFLPEPGNHDPEVTDEASLNIGKPETIECLEQQKNINKTLQRI